MQGHAIREAVVARFQATPRWDFISRLYDWHQSLLLSVLVNLLHLPKDFLRCYPQYVWKKLSRSHLEYSKYSSKKIRTQNYFMQTFREESYRKHKVRYMYHSSSLRRSCRDHRHTPKLRGKKSKTLKNTEKGSTEYRYNTYGTPQNTHRKIVWLRYSHSQLSGLVPTPGRDNKSLCQKWDLNGDLRIKLF